MYKIVIVDDEIWIAKGIACSCKWEDYGAELALVTSDAQEAQIFILENKPDIVFTDIEMGQLSGIDLMKSVRRAGISCEFVIISGYSSFEYAQNALQYDAFNYLLKPVDKKELDKVMAHLAMILKNKRQEDLSLDYIENLLLQTKVNTHKAFFELYNCKIKGEGFQTLMVEGDKDIITQVLKDYPTIQVVIGPKKICYFIRTDHDLFTSNTKQEIKNLEVKVGFSRFYEHDLSPQQAFYEADVAFCGNFIYPDESLFCYHSISRIESFTHQMLQLSLDGFLDPDFYKKEVGAFSMKEVVLIDHYLSSTLNYWTSYDKSKSEYRYRTYEEIYLEYKNMEDFMVYVQAHWMRPSLEVVEKKVTSANSMEEILAYIQKHYLEPIFLSDLAERFFYNQTYLSDMIKKALGRNFTDYVLELRINKAMDLLLSSQRPITEIALLSGYQDYCYFTKQFKKKTGMTPSTFRKETKA